MRWEYERDIAQMRADIAAGKDVDITLLKSLLVMLTDIDLDASMITIGGRKLYLYRCTPDDISIQDIAHSLSGINRFVHHTPLPISVAQHCVMAADRPAQSAVEARKVLLLHDAAECYLNDVPRPVKKAGVNWAYEMAEAHVESVIVKRFGLDSEIWNSAAIKMIDTAQCDFERECFHLYEHWSIGESRDKFLAKYAELFGGGHEYS